LVIAGRAADRFGPQRVCALWFALTALAVGLLSVKTSLPITYTIVTITGIWLFSAQTLLYANVAHYYPTGGHATAIGWAAGIGRFGAVVGPTIGGLLVGAHLLQWNFYTFAIAAIIAAVAVALVPRSPLALVPRATSTARQVVSH
jgi:AAHS family benzoate transporter-like MFS transporter